MKASEFVLKLNAAITLYGDGEMFEDYGGWPITRIECAPDENGHMGFTPTAEGFRPAAVVGA